MVEGVPDGASHMTGDFPPQPRDQIPNFRDNYATHLEIESTDAPVDAGAVCDNCCCLFVCRIRQTRRKHIYPAHDHPRSRSQDQSITASGWLDTCYGLHPPSDIDAYSRAKPVKLTAMESKHRGIQQPQETLGRVPFISTADELRQRHLNHLRPPTRRLLFEQARVARDASVDMRSTGGGFKRRRHP